MGSPERPCRGVQAAAKLRVAMRNEIQAGGLTGARFVDPVVLARVGNLELVARAVVDGFINGMHRSPYFGASVDFAEHRGYTPGDDIRRVDWKLFGTDRPLLHQGVRGRHQRQLRRASSTSQSRWGSAAAASPSSNTRKILAGCLTYLVHRQRDRVGFAAFDDDIVEYVPPSAKHMEVTLHVLDRLKPSKPGQLAPPMKKLAEHFARRGVLVLVSDFYEDPQAVLEAVAPLRFRGHDMIVFHVLDPAEIEFNYDQASAFEDLESGEQIPVVPEALAEQYRAADPRALRGAALEVLGAADRLRAVEHGDAARPRALHVLVHARAD